MSEAQAPIVSPMKVNLRKYVFNVGIKTRQGRPR